MKKRSARERKIRLVIFDLDGTLINAYAAVAESVNHTLGRLGYKSVSGARIKRSVGWGEVNLISQFVRPADLKAAVRIYRAHHPAALRRGTKLLPGAQPLLRDLHKDGYLIAVASNRAQRFSRLVARQLKIMRFFDLILCRDQVERPKPFPDVIKGILRRLRCRPQEAVFVGDMVVDVQAGKRAKVRTVAVATGSSSLKEIRASKPFRVIRKVAAVQKVLADLNQDKF